MDTPLNLIRHYVAAAPGTGPVTVGAAVTGFIALGAADTGKTFTVLFQDGDNKEVATNCLYTHSTLSLTRGTFENSTTGSALTLSDATNFAVTTSASTQALWNAKVDGDDARLSDSREWTAATVGQTEAEEGTSTTRRAWTALRVAQAIAAQVSAWWTAYSTVAGRAIVTAADASAQRTALGLGTAATTASSSYATAAQGTKADGAAQIAGDLSGTAATPVVAKINGVAVTGTPTAGQVPTATSGTAATWQTPSGGGGTPGGSSGQLQYNNSGAFGGASNVSVVGTGGGSLNCLAVGDSGANPGFVSVRGNPASNGPHGLRFWSATDTVALVGYDQGTTRTAGIGFLDYGQTALRMAITCVNGDLKTQFGGPVFPKPYTTATRPAWANGAFFFDNDIDKLVIGGASAWEVVTST